VKNLKPPKTTPVDISLEGVKALMEVFPAGSLLTYGLKQFIQLPLDKRMNEFYKNISEAINKHAQQILELSSNDRFVTILLQAGNIYIRNHQEEKLKALRNAVINSIETPSYDESIQIVFLSMIDRFTPWHLKVLSLINDSKIMRPEDRPILRSNALSAIKNFYRFFNDQNEFLSLIISDFETAGLINVGESSQSIQLGQQIRPLTLELTKIGRQFLNFISKKEKQEK